MHLKLKVNPTQITQNNQNSDSPQPIAPESLIDKPIFSEDTGSGSYKEYNNLTIFETRNEEAFPNMSSKKRFET